MTALDEADLPTVGYVRRPAGGPAGGREVMLRALHENGGERKRRRDVKWACPSGSNAVIAAGAVGRQGGCHWATPMPAGAPTLCPPTLMPRPVAKETQSQIA